jgi:DNA-binding MarR family transcriptional regulator
MNGTAVESNAPTLGFLLHEVARLLRRRFEQNARDSGLTRSQWQVLAYLANNEGINQSGLADLLEIEPITLCRIVDKLQTRGLIERRPDPSDRRAWLLHLTPAAIQSCPCYAGSVRSPAAKRWPKFRKPTPSAC